MKGLLALLGLIPEAIKGVGKLATAIKDRKGKTSATLREEESVRRKRREDKRKEQAAAMNKADEAN